MSLNNKQSVPVKPSASPCLCEKIKTKDSGIPWIGEIPVDWEIIPFKTVFRESKSVSEFGEEMLLSVSQYTGITPKKDSVSDREHLSRAESLAGYRIVHVDDFVMNIMLAWNGSLGISQYSGIVSPAYAVFKLIRKSHPQFLHFLLRTEAYTTYFRAFSSGIIESRLRLYPEIFLRLFCVLPPAGTQKRIAEFLDKKCAEIDALIALQEKMITELKSYKQSVITEAVTRGVPANIKTSHRDAETQSVPVKPSAHPRSREKIKMKDSGIPWLGSIPAHWEVRMIKRIFRIFSGTTPKSENEIYWNGEIPWVTPADYKTDDKYVSCGRKSLTNEGLASCGLTMIPQGSIIFSKRAPIGSVAITKNELCTNQGCLSCVSQENLNTDYFYFAMSVFTEQFELLGSGTTFKEISLSDFSCFPLPFPPIEEQNEITDYLNARTLEIDSLISLKQQKISTLQNYKKSVIFEYVTGKKEV